MPQVCPRCKAPVNGRSIRCPECGTRLESSSPAPAARSQTPPRTAEPPAPPAPLFADAPSPTASAVEAPPPPPFEAPSAPGKRAVIPPPRPAVPPPLAPAERIDPAPAAVAPPQPPIETPPAFDPSPVAPDVAIAQGPDQIAEDVQSWMNRMLSGATEELLTFAQPPVDPAALRESKVLPPPEPPMLLYPMLADSDDDWSDESFPPLPSVLATAASVGVSTDLLPPPSEMLEALPFTSEEAAVEEPVESEPEPAPPIARLEVLDALGEWVDWGPVPAEGRIIGREEGLPGGETLAVEHLLLRSDDANLVVDDLDSRDGVYRRIAEPVNLSDGQRFRVGGHVLEFHLPAPFQSALPLAADERGTLCSRDLEPLAYVDLIRPNGQAGLRFPITKRDATVIGREGPNACIALPDDASVSTSHAQLRPRDGAFLLEDLKSRGGTFVQLQGTTPILAGDVLQAGRLTFRVAEA